MEQLVQALEDVMEQHNPFITDVDGCECGENATGYDDDGNPCCHIMAVRAIQDAKESLR